MLSKLLIQNFRKFDRYSLEFGNRNLLVGPNNAGKSTVIEALRLVSVVVNRLTNLTFERPPDWLEAQAAIYGVYPSLRGLDFDLGKETFHQYGDPPATVSAEFTNGARVVVYVGAGGEIFGTAGDSEGGPPVQTKREARQLDAPRIGIQPQVGPVSRFERLLADRYVRGALDSTLAPTHFRNQLRVLDNYLDDFKLNAERSWPSLRVDGLESTGLGDERHLALYLRDGAFVGELAGMGHGLQMWLQLMWFLTRSKDDASIVLDEPDVYMHPDLQRRLIRLLFSRDQQVIVATHSVEMMSEVEPDELISIDASFRKGRAARKVADIQTVVDQIGGVHNIEFARLARADRCLVTPASERRVLSRWYDMVAPEDEGALDLLPAFPCEGWHEWPYLIASKRAIDRVRDDPIDMICLLPGAGIPEDLFEAKKQEAAHEGIDLRIWSRRELQSYALDPQVIARVLDPTEENIGPEVVATQIDTISDALREDARSFAERVAASLGESLDATRLIDEQWKTAHGRLTMVPGRLAVLRLSAWANATYGAKVGMRDLVAAFDPEDLDPEVRVVLDSIAIGDPVSKATAIEPREPWPTLAPSSDSAQDDGSAEELLDLFEAAGLFD